MIRAIIIRKKPKNKKPNGGEVFEDWRGFINLFKIIKAN